MSDLELPGSLIPSIESMRSLMSWDANSITWINEPSG